MSTQSFNKLVRDRIPELIEQSGRRPITRRLDDDEYFVELRRKLVEETQEFMESGTIEELADIHEVVCALAAYVCAATGALDEARATKNKQRGAFAERLFLIEVHGPESSTPHPG